MNMKLKSQKRLAAQIMKASKKRVKLDYTKLDEIKESITNADIRGLIKDKIIKVKQKKGISRVRAKKRQAQRRKGRKKGPGKRKAKINARISKKRRWINKIRVQRKFLNELRDKQIISNNTFRMLYLKAKGGFFRNKKHIKVYISEHDLILKKS